MKEAGTITPLTYCDGRQKNASTAPLQHLPTLPASAPHLPAPHPAQPSTTIPGAAGDVIRLHGAAQVMGLHGTTPRAKGWGRRSAALWNGDMVLRKWELAERAEWQGMAARRSRSPARLLRAAFSELHPAKALHSGENAAENTQLLPATTPHPSGQGKTFLQTHSARWLRAHHPALPPLRSQRGVWPVP